MADWRLELGNILEKRARASRAEQENAQFEAFMRDIVAPALNDLAELLRIVGNLSEAKRRIREAINLSPEFYVLWDTLGGILADEGDIDGASEAFARAIEIDSSDPRVNINYAKVLIRKGDIIKARTLLAEANKKKGSLQEADARTLTELLEQVAPGRGRR